MRSLLICVVVCGLTIGTIAQSGNGNPQLLCPPCAAVNELQSDLDKLPKEALADRGWALRALGINLPDSAQMTVDGHPAGFGATVVQIDTGVTDHPLLRLLNGAGEGVDVTAADGLFGVGSTNKDPLLTGLLRFPGHGTKTASVITAVPNGTFDAAAGIHGVAPGARLIPIRATEGVLILPGPIGGLNADQHKIARALNEAALGSRGLLRHDVDVISMSLGGWPPTADLCAAVKKATDANIIVVVAAGNEIKRTKYPAKCPTAIAVAGSTYSQSVWSGSAGSAEVVAAAPAEGVWTAAVKNGAYCIEASSGTSFATALVAGMAADWVALRRNRATIPKSPPEEFRRLLRETARPWTDKSLAKKYGSGIADMSRLLGAL